MKKKRGAMVVAVLTVGAVSACGEAERRAEAGATEEAGASGETAAASADTTRCYRSAGSAPEG